MYPLLFLFLVYFQDNACPNSTDRKSGILNFFLAQSPTKIENCKLYTLPGTKRRENLPPVFILFPLGTRASTENSISLNQRLVGKLCPGLKGGSTPVNSFQIIYLTEVRLLLPWIVTWVTFLGQETQGKKAGTVLGIGWNPTFVPQSRLGPCSMTLDTRDTIGHFEWVQGLLGSKKLKFSPTPVSGYVKTSLNYSSVSPVILWGRCGQHPILYPLSTLTYMHKLHEKWLWR